MMDTVLELTYSYMIVLLLALLVERIMEVAASVWTYIEWKTNMHTYWTGRAQKLKNKFESKAKTQILYRVLDLTPLTRQIRYATRSEMKGHSAKLTIISAEMIRQSVVSVASRILAAVIGILFCVLSDINLIRLFEDQIPISLTSWPVWLQLIISGVVIGLGAEPVHSLITTMEKRQASRAEKLALEKKLSGQTL